MILGGRTDEIEGVIVAKTSSYVAIGNNSLLLQDLFFLGSSLWSWVARPESRLGKI